MYFFQYFSYISGILYSCIIFYRYHCLVFSLNIMMIFLFVQIFLVLFFIAVQIYLIISLLLGNSFQFLLLQIILQ